MRGDENDDDKEAILAEMRPLIEQARREDKWLWCRYQNLWFSPEKLEAEHKAGRFIWSAVNWTLRHSQERLDEARARTLAAKAAEDQIAAEIAVHNKGPR